jgi:hypothetical protein
MAMTAALALGAACTGRLTVESTNDDGGPGSSSDAGGGGSGGSSGGNTGSSSGSSSGGGPGSSSSGSGSGGSSGSGSSSGTSSGSSSGSGSGSSSGGPCVATTNVTAIPAYTSVAQQSACTMVQIQAAVSACFSNTSSMAACNAWQSATPSCAACALGYESDGGINSDSAVDCFPNAGCFMNTDACIQITDGNDTCAAADYAVSYCGYAACGSPSCVADLMGAENGNSAANTAYNDCLNAARSVACTSQVNAWNAACVGSDIADGGTLDRCTVMTVADVVRIMAIVCDGNNQ